MPRKRRWSRFVRRLERGAEPIGDETHLASRDGPPVERVVHLSAEFPQPFQKTARCPATSPSSQVLSRRLPVRSAATSSPRIFGSASIAINYIKPRQGAREGRRSMGAPRLAYPAALACAPRSFDIDSRWRCFSPERKVRRDPKTWLKVIPNSFRSTVRFGGKAGAGPGPHGSRMVPLYSTSSVIGRVTITNGQVSMARESACR